MRQIYRIYWWVKGAPEDRPGGAWWFRDFTRLRDARAFLKDMKPFLHAWAWIDSSDYGHAELPRHTLQNIRPPKDIVVYYTENEEV